MNESKNVIAAIALSMLVLFMWDMFFAVKPDPSSIKTPVKTASTASTVKSTISSDSKVKIFKKHSNIIAETERVIINSPRISGSINLTGARLDDLILKGYKIDKNSKQDVRLLAPSGSKDSYFVEFGWLGNNITLPNKNTKWSSNKEILSPNDSVILSWDNQSGQRFERKISLDENYMFSIQNKIINYSEDNIIVKHYGFMNRSYEISKESYYILHEGPLGVINGTLEERTYKDLIGEEAQIFKNTTGWLGISDKYWLTALIPDQNNSIDITFKSYLSNGQNRFQTDYIGQEIDIAAETEYQITNQLFSGAKELTLLDAYSKQYNIELFDRSIDFGILYFLTKPIFSGLKILFNYFGNFGVAIIGLTIIIRLLLFPLASKSFREISKMRELHPEISALRERNKDDRMALNREIMALYKKHQVKPMAGCLPLLVQIPVFFALYKVLFVTIEMRHAEFFGWVHDLSAPDPTSIFNLFGLLPWGGFINIGIWPILMGISMIIQQKLNPPPTDPIQAKMMKFLPYLFTFLFATFPAGLVLYWTCNNVLSVLQQWFIMKQVQKSYQNK